VTSPERPERRKTRRPAAPAVSDVERSDAAIDDPLTPETRTPDPERAFGVAVGPVTDHASVMRRARERGGSGGALLAGAMLGLRDALEGPKKEQIAIVVDAPTEPIDVDEEGIRIDFDDTSVAAPALPPMETRKVTKWRPLRGR
jgi:hypothetical protein